MTDARDRVGIRIYTYIIANGRKKDRVKVKERRRRHWPIVVRFGSRA
jgi:hypothetical protein